MAALFENVLHASLYGSVLIGVVCLLRLLLRRAPRNALCLLWLMVGLRLLLPFEIESRLSLQPRLDAAQQVSWVQEENPVPARAQDIPEILPEFNVPAQAVVMDAARVSPAAAEKANLSLKELLPYGWLSVAVALGLCSLFSYIRLKRRTRSSIILAEGIWLCPGMDTAFVLGFIRPQIYLPAGLTWEERSFVLAHERMHIARRDPWWKLLGFATLAIHWFNPLVWLAYSLLCRDLEMACDEAVIRRLGPDARKAYSRTLVSCASQHRTLAACPVAFGEVSVKERIKNVMKYRKPKFWIILLAVLALAATAVCFLTSPTEAADDQPQPEQHTEATAAPTGAAVEATEPAEETVPPTEATEPTAEEKELLARCEAALNAFQDQKAYHFIVEQRDSGDYVRNGESRSEFYQYGSNYLHIHDYPGADQTDTRAWVERGGKQYSKVVSVVHDAANGSGYDSGWKEGFWEGAYQKPWLCRFQWDNQNITLLDSRMDGELTYVTIEVKGDPYEGMGAGAVLLNKYTVTITLDGDGKLFETITEITQTRSDGVAKTVLTSRPVAMDEGIIEDAIESYYMNAIDG